MTEDIRDFLSRKLDAHRPSQESPEDTAADAAYIRKFFILIAIAAGALGFTCGAVVSLIFSPSNYFVGIGFAATAIILFLFHRHLQS